MIEAVKSQILRVGNSAVTFGAQGISALLVAFPRLLIWPRPENPEIGVALLRHCLKMQLIQPRAGLVGYAAIYGAHDALCLASEHR